MENGREGMAETDRAGRPVVSVSYLVPAPFLGASTAVVAAAIGFGIISLHPGQKGWAALGALATFTAATALAGYLVRHLRTSLGGLFALVTYAALSDSPLFMANPLSSQPAPPTGTGLLVTTLTCGAVVRAGERCHVGLGVHVFVLAVAFWQGIPSGRRRLAAT
jgi:hypothetical protein